MLVGMKSWETCCTVLLMAVLGLRNTTVALVEVLILISILLNQQMLLLTDVTYTNCHCC